MITIGRVEVQVAMRWCMKCMTTDLALRIFLVLKLGTASHGVCSWSCALLAVLY
jgi:hypothetical protein